MKHAAEEVGGGSCEICICDWHPGHDIQMIPNPASGRGLTVYCKLCRRSADAEAVGHKLVLGAAVFEVPLA